MCWCRFIRLLSNCRWHSLPCSVPIQTKCQRVVPWVSEHISSWCPTLINQRSGERSLRAIMWHSSKCFSVCVRACENFDEKIKIRKCKDMHGMVHHVTSVFYSLQRSERYETTKNLLVCKFARLADR